MADPPDGMLEIELVYALSDEQTTEFVRVPAGSTIGQAVRLSGLPVRYPELVSDTIVVGIFGRRAAPDTVLHNDDRIEFYRPLIADPRQIRRVRAGRRSNSKR